MSKKSRKKQNKNPQQVIQTNNLEKTINQNQQKQMYDTMKQMGMVKSTSSSNGAGAINSNLYGGYTDGVKGIREPGGIFTQSNTAKGIREKYTQYGFSVLREIARKVSVIPSIQTTRIQQIRPFSKFSFNDDNVGYRIKMKDRDAIPDNKDKKQMKEMAEYIQHSGYKKVNGILVKRENFYDMLSMNTPEMMTIDQVALSLQRNRMGQIISYNILDGAYIKRTVEGKGYNGDKNIKFVQEINGHITATFKEEEIMFIVNNKRSNLLNKGYGYSFLEQAIDLITGWLYAMGHNKEAFSSSAQPKGFITFQGEKLDQGDLEELQRQWTSMFSGIKGLWKVPFLQNDAKWNSVAPSNQDMQWDKYTQKLESWICGIHGIDAAEMGQRINQAQNVLNENPEAKIAYSKDRGLKDLLSFHAKYVNEICDDNEEWEKFEMVFTGVEDKNQKAEADVDKTRNEVYATVNEIRAEKDLPPISGGDVINNPGFLQSQQAQQMKEQEEQQQDESFDEEEDYSDDEIDQSLSSLEKSFKTDDYVEIEV